MKSGKDPKEPRQGLDGAGEGRYPPYLIEHLHCLLEVNGFEVRDIGIDQPPEKSVEAIRDFQPDVVVMSGLALKTLDLRVAQRHMHFSGRGFLMKIIGERINGTWTQVNRAVSERDVAFIQRLAQRQVEAGVDWLDLCAGTSPEREPDDLVWLVQTVQEAVDVPLCLDSANPGALAAAIKQVRQTPLINSLSGERMRLDGILPLVRENGCAVIALAMDDKGIPSSMEDRLTVIQRVVDTLRRAGVPDDRVYVDPLVMAIAANTESGRIALDTMRAVRVEFPHVHLTSGLSNISFGLPVRSYINRAFLTLALEAGLDTAILDPLDRELRKALLAAEVVLGRDRYCLNYTRAYRAGLLNGPGAKAGHE